MGNKEKIEQLKKELKHYSEKDEMRVKAMQDQQRIKDLKKQIRLKKYGGLVQAGKNVGTISKNIYCVGKNVAKELGKAGSKFIGEDPNQKGKKKVKTVEEIMRDLPQ